MYTGQMFSTTHYSLKAPFFKWILRQKQLTVYISKMAEEIRRHQLSRSSPQVNHSHFPNNHLLYLTQCIKGHIQQAHS